MTLLGGAAVAWSEAARGQQRDRMKLVAMLAGGDGKVGNLTQIQKELEKLGWVGGATSGSRSATPSVIPSAYEPLRRS
jgi:hypothetical protein